MAGLRGLNGWALRGLTALVILAALTGPSYQQEARAPLTDIVILLEDESASQGLSDRTEQTNVSTDILAERLTSRSNTEVRRVKVPDGEGDAGTQLMTALSGAVENFGPLPSSSHPSYCVQIRVGQVVALASVSAC